MSVEASSLGSATGRLSPPAKVMSAPGDDIFGGTADQVNCDALDAEAELTENILALEVRGICECELTRQLPLIFVFAPTVQKVNMPVGKAPTADSDSDAPNSVVNTD